jgi:hypothetical protein
MIVFLPICRARKIGVARLRDHRTMTEAGGGGEIGKG